jgi:hypothetical protein
MSEHSDHRWVQAAMISERRFPRAHRRTPDGGLTVPASSSPLAVLAAYSTPAMSIPKKLLSQPLRVVT